MKKLSDYKNEEAIELWGDLIQPISVIVSKDAVKKAVKDEDRTIATIAKAILKECPKEVSEVLTRIDGSELNGFNILSRLMALLSEFNDSEEFGSFFTFAEQGSAENVHTGSATENTTGGKH